MESPKTGKLPSKMQSTPPKITVNTRNVPASPVRKPASKSAPPSPTTQSTKRNPMSPKSSVVLQPSSILPGQIPSERELASEFRAIAEVLNTKTQEEWSNRHKALMKLEELILGGVHEYPNFLHDFNVELKTHIGKMV